MQGYFFSFDGKYILYIKDENGDLNINIFAVDESVAEANKVPVSNLNL
jgi:hypothetical protein